MAIDRAYNLGDEAVPSPEEEIVELDTLAPEAPDSNIEIVEEEDGGAIVDFAPQSGALSQPDEHLANLAEHLSDDVLQELAGDLVDAFDKDDESRSEWKETYIKGLDLIGMKMEDREDPFPGASGVHHPLLAESITQFQAQAYKELLPAEGPVSTKVLGAETPELTDQANRVAEFMNYQIMEVMDEFDPDLDQLLYYLPIAGSAFKKTYYDGVLDRPVSKFVTAEDLVVNYGATSLRTADRITHVVTMSGNDIKKNQYNGFYRETELDEGNPNPSDIQDKVNELQGLDGVYFDGDNNYKLLEMHVNLDLEGFEHQGEDGQETGIALPYIVTIDSDSEIILSIRRNWEKSDPKQKRKEFFTHYKFTPGLGFYGFGLVHMIGGLAKSVTSILRQLIDAGTLANLPGGFKAKGMRVEGSDEPISPGEWRDVDTPGGNLRESLMPLPYKEPSGVLTQLLGALVESGQRFASIADIQVGDTAGQQQPVGTTVAMLERGTKVMSAIHKRMHYAQKQEFRVLARVIKESIPPQYPYMTTGQDQMVMQKDFDDRVDILPVSDPNIFSMAQRIMLAQQQMQMAQAMPEIHNLRAAHVKMYKAMGIDDIESILQPDDNPQPVSPAVEHTYILQDRKLQAFEGQDHDAHIMAHIAFSQNPTVNQNPSFYANLVQDVMQHIGFKALQTFQMMGGGQQQPMQGQPQPFANGGMPMPPNQQAPNQPTLEQIEAKMIAEIMPQIAPPSQEDPLVKLQARQLDIQEQEGIRKSQLEERKLGQIGSKDQATIQIKQQELGIKQMGLQAPEEQSFKREEIASDERIAAQKVQASMQETAMELASKERIAAMDADNDITVAQIRAQIEATGKQMDVQTERQSKAAELLVENDNSEMQHAENITGNMRDMMKESNKMIQGDKNDA